MKKLAVLWITLLLKDIQQYSSNGLYHGNLNENIQYESVPPPCLQQKHRLQKRGANEQLINYGYDSFPFDTQTPFGNTIQYGEDPYLKSIQKQNGYAEDPYGQMAQNIIQDPYEQITNNIIQDPNVQMSENVIEDPYGQIASNIIQDPYAQYHEDGDPDLCRHLHRIWEHKQYVQYRLEQQKAMDIQSNNLDPQKYDINSIDALSTYGMNPKHQGIHQEYKPHHVKETEHQADDDPRHGQGYQHPQDNSLHDSKHHQPQHHDYHQTIKSGEDNHHGHYDENKNSEGKHKDIEHPIPEDQGGGGVIDLEEQPMYSNKAPEIVQHDDHSIEKDEYEFKNSKQNENDNEQNSTRETDEDQEDDLSETKEVQNSSEELKKSNSDESTVGKSEENQDNTAESLTKLEEEREENKSLEFYDSEEEDEEEEEEDIVKYYKYK